MENNLIELAKSYVNQEKLKQLSDQTGETNESLNSGLTTIIPSIFLALQNQSETSITGIFEQIKGYFTNQDISEHVSQNDSDQIDDAEQFRSTSLIKGLFGENFDSILSTLSNYLHLKSSSVKELIHIALPAVFGSLTSKGSNINSYSIKEQLEKNQANFAAAIPSGIGLATFGPGFVKNDHDESKFATPNVDPSSIQPIDNIDSASIGNEPIIDPVKSVVINEVVNTNMPKEPINDPHASPNKPPYKHTAETVQKKSGTGYWWILIPILLILGWFLFGKGCSNNDNSMTAMDSSTNRTIAPDTNVTLQNSPSNKEEISVNLPNGNSIQAFSGGIEDNLVKFLQSDYKSMTDDQLKDTWFDFDHVNFELGTAIITEDSKLQLSNLAAVLAVFPDAKIKIGGYTDKTGDEELNKKLSLDRANAVKEYLVSAGQGSQVTDTEGYGSSFAKFDATAPESERILDRRVSISVRK